MLVVIQVKETMISQDLLLKLKENGYSFREHDDDQIDKIDGGLGYSTNLSELIEAIVQDKPNSFYLDYNDN